VAADGALGTNREDYGLSIISNFSCVYIVHSTLDILLLFICVCVCLWRSEVNLGVIFFRLFFFFFLRQGLSLVQNPLNILRLEREMA
jgi:hypothetical protein